MKNYEKKYGKYWYAGVTGFCVIVASVLVYFIFENISGLGSILSAINTALFPVYVGLVVAYLLSPFVDKMDEKIYIPLWGKVFKNKKNKIKGMARGCSVFTAVIVAVLLICGLLMLVIPEIVNSITSLIDNLPGYYRSVRQWGNSMFKSNPTLVEYYTQFSGMIYEKVMTSLKDNGNMLFATFRDGVLNATTLIVNLFIGLIISIYLMAGKEKFCAQAKKFIYALLSEKRAAHLFDTLGELHIVFGKFIRGKIIDSLVVGIVTFILLNIAGIPYTVLISVLIGVTNIIPFFGPYIGIIPSALLVMIVSPSKAILFLILIIVLMQVDGNVISPKILGDSIGLESFWILFSILFFGSLFGVLGMICAVPVFAVAYRMTKRWCANRLVRKNMPTETAYYRKENESLKEAEESEQAVDHTK